MILRQFSNNSLSEFQKDLSLIMNVAIQLDQEGASMGSQFSQDYREFKELVDAWNKKYRMLMIKIYDDGMQIRLRIILRSAFRDVIEKAISIDGIEKVNGHTDLEQGLELTTKKIDINYMIDDSLNSLTLEETNDGIRLIYLSGDLLDMRCPEFKICAHYALSDKRDIDIQKMGDSFSFDTSLEAAKGKGISYLDRVKIFGK